MKSSRELVPVILVGGGAALLGEQIAGAARLLRPDHAGVANAIGAANAQIGVELERIVSYGEESRDQVMDELQEELRAQLLAAGARRRSLRLAEVEETAISYMANDAKRLRVKMVGDLALYEDDT